MVNKSEFYKIKFKFTKYKHLKCVRVTNIINWPVLDPSAPMLSLSLWYSSNCRRFSSSNISQSPRVFDPELSQLSKSNWIYHSVNVEEKNPRITVIINPNQREQKPSNRHYYTVAELFLNKDCVKGRHKQSISANFFHISQKKKLEMVQNDLQITMNFYTKYLLQWQIVQLRMVQK